MADRGNNMWVGQRQSRFAVPGVCFFLLPLFCSVLLVSLFSDFIPTAFGAYADQRFFQAGLMVFVIVASLGWKGGGGECHRLLTSTWPGWLVATGFILLALPFTSTRFNWVEPGLFALFFLAFTTLGWRIHQERASQLAVVLLAYVSAVACFFYAAMTITVYLFAITDHFSELTDVIPWGFVNMRYWSHLATWLLPVLPIALLMGPFSQNRKWQWGVGFAAGFWWWMVFMTTARGSMMSLVLAAVLVYLVFGKAVVPWLRTSGRFLAFGVLAWVLLSVVIPSIVFEEVAVRSLHSGSSGRLPLWWQAWNMSLENFPLGQGPQSWLTHEWMAGNGQPFLRLGHPHNMYLMWAAEYGWVLIMLLLVLALHASGKLLIVAKKSKPGPDDAKAPLVAIFVSVLAGLVHAGLSAVFIVPASMLVGLCILALCWALIQADEQPEQVPGMSGAQLSRGRRCRAVLLSAVVAGGGYWLGQVWDYHRAMERDLVIYEQGPNAAYFPRFWFHGNFPRAEQGSGPAFAED